MSETVEQVAIGAEELQRIQKMSQATANKSVQSILRKTVRIEYSSVACLACVVFMIVLNYFNNQRHYAAIEKNEIALQKMQAALQDAVKLTNK